MPHLNLLEEFPMKNILFLLTFLVFATPTSARLVKMKASPNVIIDFSPKKVIQEAEPGQTVLVKLQAMNKTKEDVKAAVVLKEWHFDENGKFNYDKIKKGEPGPYSLIPHVKLLNPSFDLKAGEVKEATIEIKVPKDFKGSKGLLMSVRPDAEWKKLKSKKDKKAGVTFSVAYTGPLIINSKSTSKINLLAKNNIKYKTGNLRVSSMIHLKGNSFISEIQGKYVVLDKNNKNVLKGDLRNSSKQPRIYPENKRKFLGGSAVNLKKGEYKIVISYFAREYGFSKTYEEKFSVK